VNAARHVRVNTGLLAAAEKRALVWVARRLPAWVNSDHLTALALLSMAGTGAAFWAGGHHRRALLVVIPCLALNWFGDSLDGTLARVRGHERPRFGFYVDHVLDIAGAGLLLAGIALSGFMSPSLAMALLASYLLVSAEVFLATGVGSEFRMSFLRLGPTELRVVLAAGTLALMRWPWVSPWGLGQVRLFDLGAAVAIPGLLVAFLVSSARTTVALYRAEPRPRARARQADAVSPSGSCRV
jgi:phosphatidylglycerophosphate synthase